MFFDGRKLHFKYFWGFNLTLKKQRFLHLSHFLYKTEGFTGQIRRNPFVTNKDEYIPVLKNNIESQIKKIKQCFTEQQRDRQCIFANDCLPNDRKYFLD